MRTQNSVAIAHQVENSITLINSIHPRENQDLDAIVI